MKNNNDIIIIEKTKAGDISAFRILVDKYKDVSFSLACSILKDEHESEDALQEAFLRAFRNVGKFNYKSSFSTWLYRIVVNTCLTIEKKHGINKLNEPNFNLSNNEAIDEITGFDKLSVSNRREIIDAALTRMKSDEALLLRLYYLSELNVAEIKEITGFRESSIRVTLHRARKSLHDQLKKLLGEEIKLLL